MTTIERSGIPTIFKGVRHRSRLEARWHAFFLSLGWPVHYEPFDLNGWIPDFIIRGHDQVLVEVKPIHSRKDDLFRRTVLQIRESGWVDEVLIVSYFLPKIESSYRVNYPNVPCVGWLRSDRHADAVLDWYEPAPFQMTDFDMLFNESNPLHFGFCSHLGSYHNRITGFNPRGIYGPSDEWIGSRWAEAGNATQWMSKG